MCTCLYCCPPSCWATLARTGTWENRPVSVPRVTLEDTRDARRHAREGVWFFTATIPFLTQPRKPVCSKHTPVLSNQGKTKYMEWLFIHSIEVKSVLLCMWREKNRKIRGEKSSPQSKATANNDIEMKPHQPGRTRMWSFLEGGKSEKIPRSKTRTEN